MRRSGWAWWALAGCLAIVSGCGGGGGGGGGGSGDALSVSSDRTSFQFLGFDSAPPGPQSVNFTLVNGSGTYFGDVVSDQPTAFSAVFTPTSSTTAAVTMTPVNPPTGTRSGTLTFRLCSDSRCDKVAWSRVIPYTISVFAIDVAGLSIAGAEGVAEPSRNVAVTPADTGHLLAVAVNTSSGGSWLSATHGADSTIAVVASGVGIVSGSFQGTVTVSFAGQTGTPSVVVPVAFTVGSGIVAPAARTLELTVGVTAASLGSTLPVAFRGAQMPAWTASSDQPWLVLSGASGTGAGSLQYAVDATRLGGIANWSSGIATVRIGAPGVSDVLVPITLNKKLPEVYGVSANTVIAGRAASVRVTGRGFAQLADASQVRIGGAAAATGTIASDTQALLAVPPLAAGKALVGVANAANLPTSSGSLTAVPLSALASASAPNTGEKRSALFDPSRSAIYATNRSLDTLVRFRLVGGVWQVAALPVAAIGDMAMAPDRRTIYVGSGASTLQAVDPDTLTVRATHTIPATVPLSLTQSRYRTRGMAQTANQRLWLGGTGFDRIGYFDMLHGSFEVQMLPPALSAGNYLYAPQFYASGDGSFMLAAQSIVSPPFPNFVYLAATDTFSAPVGVPLVSTGAVLTEDGGKVLVENSSLYETGGFTLLGRIDPYASGIVTGTAISPDGSRIYALTSASINTLTIDHIDVYDTAQLQVGSSLFVKVGQIAVTDQALNCPLSGSDCDPIGLFLLSPLGDTLFWVGNQGLVVLPIPTGLSGIASARQGLYKAGSGLAPPRGSP